MTVKIYVKDKTTKTPVRFVSVRIESMNLSEADDTDGDGIAEFDTIVDGKYNIKIRHADYRPYTEKMFISRNSVITIKLQRAWD